jgi:hypothetical protein
MSSLSQFDEFFDEIDRRTIYEDKSPEYKNYKENENTLSVEADNYFERSVKMSSLERIMWYDLKSKSSPAENTSFQTKMEEHKEIFEEMLKNTDMSPRDRYIVFTYKDLIDKLIPIYNNYGINIDEVKISPNAYTMPNENNEYIPPVDITHIKPGEKYVYIKSAEPLVICVVSELTNEKFIVIECLNNNSYSLNNSSYKPGELIIVDRNPPPEEKIKYDFYHLLKETPENKNSNDVIPYPKNDYNKEPENPEYNVKQTSATSGYPGGPPPDDFYHPAMIYSGKKQTSATSGYPGGPPPDDFYHPGMIGGG